MTNVAVASWPGLQRHLPYQAADQLAAGGLERTDLTEPARYRCIGHEGRARQLAFGGPRRRLVGLHRFQQRQRSVP